MKKITSILLVFCVLLSLFGCQSKTAEVKVEEKPSFRMKTTAQYANAIEVAKSKRNGETAIYMPENYNIEYANVIFDREFSKNELLNAPLEENILTYIVCIADSFDVDNKGKKEKIKDTSFYACTTTKERWATYMEKYLVDDKEKTKKSLKEGAGLVKDLLSLDILGVADDVYNFYDKNSDKNYNESVNEILRNVTEDVIQASYIEYAKFIIDPSCIYKISVNDLSKYLKNNSDLEMAQDLVKKYGDSKTLLVNILYELNGENKPRTSDAAICPNIGDVGSKVKIGKYEYIVLKKYDKESDTYYNCAYLLCTHKVENVQYNKNDKCDSYFNSSLHKYLNDKFYNDAFSKNEKKYLMKNESTIITILSKKNIKAFKDLINFDLGWIRTLEEGNALFHENNELVNKNKTEKGFCYPAIVVRYQ